MKAEGNFERLKAYVNEQLQVKSDLIQTAEAAEKANWAPQYLWPDRTLEATLHRKWAVSDLIEKRGGFSHHVASLALTDPAWETKETVASWLRKELGVLRDAEAKSGSAPVRLLGVLSRTEISDVAVELLECIGGEALVCLFQELLDIDRHRKSLADGFIQLDKAAQTEAQLELQGVKIGVRELAKEMAVSPSTVTRWRKSPSFREHVNHHRLAWRRILQGEYEQIRKDTPGLSEAEYFREAFQRYARSIPERRERYARSIPSNG
jgi:hypothetical protein